MKQLLAILIFAGASAHALPREKTNSISEASYVTEVSFVQGSSELTADSKAQIKDILGAAQVQGTIEEVKIVAYADQDYPVKAKTRDPIQRKLADMRGSEIKGFIQSSVEKVDVDVYNMAERPNTLQNLLKAGDGRVKRSLETAGLTGYKAKDAKQSRALVMVILK